MVAARIAKSLDTLRSQVNAAAPHRSKASDGWIGDPAHAARSSDHNAGPDGIVQALDITDDRANGCSAQEIWDDLRREGDQRFGYMIWNRRIWNPSQDKIGDNGRAYNGKNPHTKHIHISVHKYLDNTSLWPVIFGDAPPIAVKPMDPAMSRPKLYLGGPANKTHTLDLQRKLKDLGYYKGKLDGGFGPLTKAAVVAYQKTRADLDDDGVVGAYTWGALFPDAGKPVTTAAPVALAAIPVLAAAPIAMDAWYEPGHFPEVSDFGQLWVETIESFKAEAYMDAGTPAQGFGHNAGSGVQPIPKIGGPKWTLEYAREVLEADLRLQVHYLKAYVKVPLLQRHVDALALDIFQLGPGNWKKDPILALINKKDYEGAAKWMRDRVDAKGLDRRRNRQADIFLGMKPDPKTW